MANGNKESQWTKTIQQLIAERRLTSHQCILYNKTYQQQANNDEECGCQRPIRQHSFDEIFEGERPKPKDWNVKEHTRNLDRLIYLSNPICKVSYFKISYQDHHEVLLFVYYLGFKMCM